MSSNAEFRPGVVLIVCGVVFVALSVVRVATAPAVDAARWSAELFCCAAGAALGLWGWSRLRRAKASCPDLSWPRFLRDELVGFSIVAVVLAGFLALAPHQRDRLVRGVWQLFELFMLVKVGP